MRIVPAVVLVAVFAAAAASAQPPERQGSIVFASNRTLNFWAADVMLSHAGGRTRNLTQSVGIADRDADISPTGRQIVFSRRQVADEDLYALTIPGRQLRRLTSTPKLYETHPVYSPAGDAVAFVRGTLHDDDALWITDLHGRERALTPSSGYKDRIAWSPDGTRLAFTDHTESLFVIRRDGSALLQIGSVRGGTLLAWERSGIVIGVDHQTGYRLQVRDPDRGSSRRLQNPCGDATPTYSSDRRHVVCHGLFGRTVRIRSRRGALVRTVTVHPKNQSTHIRRFALGPHGKALVYDAEADERHADLWLLDSRLRRLTGGPAEDHDPALSPDRRRVVFVRGGFQDRRGEGAVMVVDVATKRARALRRGLQGSSPSWSPDGQAIVFAFRGDLFVVGRSRGRPRPLTRDRNLDLYPSWSPNGHTIAFVRYGRDRSSIRTIAPRGGRSREVYAAAGADLSWSADSRSLAFSRVSEIYVIALESRNARQLVRDEQNRLSSPTWSPDGRTIAYASGWENDIPSHWQRPNAHHLQIRTVDIATGAQARLISGYGFDFSPDWR
jgi:Tol biopolymer transport system component